MKISELSKQLGVTPRDIIDYLKSEGYSDIHSHLQKLEDDVATKVREHFESQPKNEVKEEIPKSKKVEAPAPIATATKTFAPDDMIPCRSVCPFKLNALGVDGRTVYHWEQFGDTEYVTYRDLQAMRRKDIVTNPYIIIEDPDLCNIWRKEIGEIYAPYIGVNYPEELLELPDEKFAELLKTGTNTFREIVKVTAMNMIKNQNYPTVNKLQLIDSILGTCIKEFL